MVATQKIECWGSWYYSLVVIQHVGSSLSQRKSQDAMPFHVIIAYLHDVCFQFNFASISHPQKLHLRYKNFVHISLRQPHRQSIPKFLNWITPTDAEHTAWSSFSLTLKSHTVSVTKAKGKGLISINSSVIFGMSLNHPLTYYNPQLSLTIIPLLPVSRYYLLKYYHPSLTRTGRFRTSSLSRLYEV
jgi:hypothetical protein